MKKKSVPTWKLKNASCEFLSVFDSYEGLCKLSTKVYLYKTKITWSGSHKTPKRSQAEKSGFGSATYYLTEIL